MAFVFQSGRYIYDWEEIVHQIRRLKYWRLCVPITYDSNHRLNNKPGDRSGGREDNGDDAVAHLELLREQRASNCKLDRV